MDKIVCPFPGVCLCSWTKKEERACFSSPTLSEASYPLHTERIPPGEKICFTNILGTCGVMKARTLCSILYQRANLCNIIERVWSVIPEGVSHTKIPSFFCYPKFIKIPFLYKNTLFSTVLTHLNLWTVSNAHWSNVVFALSTSLPGSTWSAWKPRRAWTTWAKGKRAYPSWGRHKHLGCRWKYWTVQHVTLRLWRPHIL